MIRPFFILRMLLAGVLALSAAPPDALARQTSVAKPAQPSLQDALDALLAGFNGQVGISVRDLRSGRGAGVAADEAFPMQSVVKLPVAIAVLDRVDAHALNLAEPVVLHVDDLSLYHQPLADLVRAAGPGGYRTTVEELLRRMVLDSDNLATDWLIARLGGPEGVQAVLDAKGLGGVRIDRDERHLQTALACLDWREEYADDATLDAAKAAVPLNRRLSCRTTYLNDPRDTARPAAMTVLLARLANGDLLSKAQSKRLLDLMAATTLAPKRLMAGTAPRWKLAHRTGTGPTVDGVALATNDVGLLTAPDGHKVAVSVFIASTAQSRDDAETLISAVAKAVTAQR